MKEMTKNYLKYIIVVVAVIGCLLALTQLTKAEEMDEDEWVIQLKTTVHHPNGGTDTVFIGEHPDGTDGIDEFDVPKYPMEPPDRAHIWSYRPDLDEPYDRMWRDIRRYPNTEQEWVIRTLFYNAYCPLRVVVTIKWNSTYISEHCEYDNIELTLVSGNPILTSNRHSVDMKLSDSFILGVRAYQMCTFKVVCDVDKAITLTPPNKPMINGPVEINANTEYDWDFMCSGYNSIRYRIKWGDNLTDVTGWVNGNSWTSIHHTYNRSGNFTIKARTENKDGEVSEWREHLVKVINPRRVPRPGETIKPKMFALGICYSITADEEIDKGFYPNVATDWLCIHHHGGGRLITSSVQEGIRQTYIFSRDSVASICMSHFKGDIIVWDWVANQHLVLVYGEHTNMKVHRL